MVFGVLSDIHDNIVNLEKSISMMRKKHVNEIIFCGDFCSPFSAKILAETQMPVHCVFGNNDGDRFNIINSCSNFELLKIYGEYIGDVDSQLIIDGVKIGVTHYPYYAKPMAKTGWYDCVFYGHNHKADKQKFSNCLMLNPGEIAGVFGKPSFAIYDTTVKSSDIIFF